MGKLTHTQSQELWQTWSLEIRIIWKLLPSLKHIRPILALIGFGRHISLFPISFMSEQTVSLGFYLTETDICSLFRKRRLRRAWRILKHLKRSAVCSMKWTKECETDSFSIRFHKIRKHTAVWLQNQLKLLIHAERYNYTTTHNIHTA